MTKINRTYQFYLTKAGKNFQKFLRDEMRSSTHQLCHAGCIVSLLDYQSKSVQKCHSMETSIR